MKRIFVFSALILCMLFATSGAWAVRGIPGNLIHKGVSGHDVTGYGAKGDGSTDDRTAINNAATAAAGGRLIFPAGTYKLSSNLSLDEDVQFHKGASLSVDGGVTITLTGAITAGHYQIFSGAGSVIISAATNEISPEWFGGSSVTTITDGDATPSVAQGRLFKTANTGPTTITDFDNGIAGQVIRIVINDGNTIFDFTTSGLKGNGGVDFTAVAGDSVIAVYDGTDWYCAASQSVTDAVILEKDLVTTSPLTGGENNILVGSDSDVTLAVTVLKDIVAGTGLTGGEDDVLPGADADITLNIDTTWASTFPTLDTGQGANELYDMDQNVLTTSTPAFAA